METVKHLDISVDSYRQSLLERYQLGELHAMLTIQQDLCHSLVELRKKMERRMKEEKEPSRSNDCWRSLFARRWFSALPALTKKERIDLICVCADGFSVETAQPDEIDQILSDLDAKPKIWRVSGRHFVIGNENSSDPILELRRQDRGLFVTRATDEMVIFSLVHSCVSDTSFARASRNVLVELFWKAWDAHLAKCEKAFDQFAFVAEEMPTHAATAYCSLAHGLELWRGLPMVLIFDPQKGALSFCERGMFNTIPDIFESTKRLDERLSVYRASGYDGLHGGTWVSHGFKKRLHENLESRRTFFSIRPRAQLTLHDALLGAMSELDLKQAFFGDVLLTRPEYLRSCPDEKP